MDALGPILAKVLESAAREGGAGVGAWIASAAGLGPAAPVAAVAGAALQALASALVEFASPIEEKLDRLIREPWRTGSRELLESLRLPAKTEAERRLRADRVRDAVKRLETAATHAAESEDEPLRLLIAALQALGYASLSGGKPSAQRRLGPLQARAQALRDQAEEAEARSRDPETAFRAPQRDAMVQLGEMREGPRRRFDVQAGKDRVAELREQAASLRAQADAFDRFCRLVTAGARRSR